MRAESTAKIESLPHRWKRIEQSITRTYHLLAQRAQREEPLPLLGEWVLDHYRLVESHLLAVRDNLPRFSKKLPRVADGPLQGYPRVYAIARNLVDERPEPLDVPSVVSYLHAIQNETTLLLGELWALDSFVRLALLESLANAAERALSSGAERDAGTAQATTAIESLRTLDAGNWRDLVEEVSVVQDVLRRDPAGVFAQMDFNSRDQYRRVIEGLARRSKFTEAEVAEKAIEIASAGTGDADRHVGYYLAGPGELAFRRALGYRTTIREQLARVLRSCPNLFYLGAIFCTTVLIVWVAQRLMAPLPGWAWILFVLPASEIAIAFVNQLVPMFVSPRRLPRLDFSDGIPADCNTMVVIPTLLLSEKGVNTLLEDLEVRYLANPDPQVTFALLTDFADAKAPTSEQDHLLDRCVAGIRRLNERHANSGRAPFYLFHRPREWNPHEAAWMGRERKRGKLIHFNSLLLGEADVFHTKEGDLSVLPKVRYVITLDTDTQLPRDTAQQMVATMAHPLNRAVIDPKTNTVRQGYGILQPRVTVSVQSAQKSLLARIYSGQTGIDPYTTAVSDVYQDLYGEGSYTGKGIYDVAAFQKTVSKRFPTNSLLSHDLIEGAHARAGLATDIEVVDDYPSHYRAYSKRKHRWVRGDWQIMLWLLPRVPHYSGAWVPNPLSLLSRWKIVDNLRRSLMEIAWMLLLLVGWFVLAEVPARWSLLLFGFLLAPAYSELALSLLRIPAPRLWKPFFRDVADNFILGHTNALLTLTFLPQQATLMADAISRAMIRRLFTKVKLLEWESMAQAEATAAADDPLATAYLWTGPAVGIVAGCWLDALYPDELLSIFAMIIPWLLSPVIASWLDRPLPAPEALRDKDRPFLRALGLRTWRYFADYAGERDHWLIPDHVQEEPATIAHRTSPTNIGMQLNSQLAARDFGYLTSSECVETIERTLRSMLQMDRYRGHFYNWYETLGLQKIQPFFISTVDSGNLAASLLVMKQGAIEFARMPVIGRTFFAGLADHCQVLSESLPDHARTSNMLMLLNQLQSTLAVEPAHLFLWQESLLHVRALLTRLEREWNMLDLAHSEQCAESNRWLQLLQERLAVLERETVTIAPWLDVRFDLQIRLRPSAPAYEQLFKLFAHIPSWSQAPGWYDKIRAEIERVLASKAALPEGMPAVLSEIPLRLPAARQYVESLRIRYDEVAGTCDRLVREMDFSFLLHPKRKLLVTGWDANTNRPEKACYDLLASEARMAAFLAVAKGDAPRESWFLLGRALTTFADQRVLLSWTGTMFEYLMPALYMRSYEGTLVHHSLKSVVSCQQHYAELHHIPWGISESAYSQRDALHNYQYQAFGVPALGLKRGLSRELVIAPYATALALMAEPREAVENLQQLVDRGWRGRYGMYESIDFSPHRLTLGQSYHVVRAYMAHHQGMSLLAIDNVLHRSPMADRFHADPLVQATELLLQERLPSAALVETPRAISNELLDAYNVA